MARHLPQRRLHEHRIPDHLPHRRRHARPGALVTLAAGLSQGRRAAVLAALGCTLGIVPHMLAAITGLAALLHASALAFEAVKLAGVLILLHMAWSTLRAASALQVESAGPVRPARELVTHAVAVNLLNPKLSIFFLAFLPQFVEPADAGPALQMLQLSGIFMAMTFAVFALYGVFAARMRTRVLSRPGVLAWLRRGFAGAFVAMGLKLALAER